MTRNQIDFWNMRETGRHNRATEVEVGRHNRVSEAVDLGNLQELSRHNLATEAVASRNADISQFSAAEAARHNRATEALTGTDLNIKAGTLTESIRHNLSTERIQQQQADTAEMIGVAEKALKEAQTLWTTLKGDADVKLSQSQRNKIDQEIAKLQSDIQLGKYDRILNTINTGSNSLTAGARLLDALIPDSIF